MKRLVILPLSLLFLYNCTPSTEKGDHLGEAHIKVTGKPEALPHFEKGLLLLHSFEYEDAREEFLAAQRLDPEFAMAYWGEAMTYNHSLWSEQDFELAVKALNNLDPDLQQRVEKATSGLEKDFIRAVNILYGPGKTKSERDVSYAKFMGSLNEKYPENHEVAAFYALSLLGSVSEGRDAELYERGAQIAKGILAENANHPGALHYLIHSYDDPHHAHLALEAANSYAVVAPDASHALHMPSHIYVALGMWDRVVSSNEDSYSASLQRMERKNLDHDARGYHSFHWLQYGYLQQGRTEEARKMLEDMIQYATELPSKSARTHLVFLKSTYLTEANDWDRTIVDSPVKINDLNIVVRTKENFNQGYFAWKQGDLDGLEEAITAIAKDREKEATLTQSTNLTICGAATRESARQIQIDQSEVMQIQLQALKSWAKKDTATTEKWLKKAADQEESLDYSYGPPLITKPSRALYGEWLIEVNRPEKALEQFDMALVSAPKRVLSLKGKLKAAQLLEDRKMVETIQSILNEIIRHPNNLNTKTGL